MVITAVAVGAIDHLTKWLVVNHVRLDTQVPAGSPVTIHYITELGAAFGSSPVHPSSTWCGGIVPGTSSSTGPHGRWAAPPAALGGTSGLDLQRHRPAISGSVVDFIDFHFWLFRSSTWPDMAIVGGMLVVVYQLGFRNDSVASE